VTAAGVVPDRERHTGPGGVEPGGDGGAPGGGGVRNGGPGGQNGPVAVGGRRGRDGAAVVVPVRVRPGAGNTRVGGGYQGRYGAALVVAVNAPAVDGRATEVARRAVADALGLRPAGVTLRAGRTSRDKLFEVADPPADLDERIRALRDG
jgi:hypothetical protein